VDYQARIRSVPLSATSYRRFPAQLLHASRRAAITSDEAAAAVNPLT
jgi:hypothetical protein